MDGGTARVQTKTTQDRHQTNMSVLQRIKEYSQNLSFMKLFYLLDDTGAPIKSEIWSNLDKIPLPERPVLVTCTTRTPLDTMVLWGLKRLPR